MVDGLDGPQSNAHAPLPSNQPRNTCGAAPIGWRVATTPLLRRDLNQIGEAGRAAHLPGYSAIACRVEYHLGTSHMYITPTGSAYWHSG